MILRKAFTYLILLGALLFLSVPAGPVFCQSEADVVSVLLEEALTHINGGRLDKAGEILEKAEKDYPDNDQVQEVMARFLYRKGDYLNAAEKFEKLAEKFPDNSLFKIMEGRCYYLLNNYGRAAEILSGIKSEALGDDRADVYLMLGESYFQLKSYDNASAFLNKALDINKEMLLPHVTLGRIYQQKKMNRLAITHFEKALNHRDADGKIKSQVSGYIGAMNQQLFREKVMLLAVPAAALVIIVIVFLILKQQRERYGSKYEEEEEVEDFYG